MTIASYLVATGHLEAQPPIVTGTLIQNPSVSALPGLTVAPGCTLSPTAGMKKCVDLGEVSAHLLALIHGAIASENKSSAVSFHFFGSKCLGEKPAIYLHQLLDVGLINTRENLIWFYCSV